MRVKGKTSWILRLLSVSTLFFFFLYKRNITVANYRFLSTGNFLFEVKTGFVHGNYRDAKKLSEMTWAPEEFPTTKGPYGHTGLYGDSDNVKGEWTCIPERDFFEAMRWGLLRFNN